MRRERRPLYAFLVALSATLAAGCASAPSVGDRTSAVPGAPADEASSSQQHFLSKVKAVSPAVVQVRTSPALGSGVVFQARANAVTNAHIVDDAARLAVTLASGESHPATLVGKDAGIDLAAIRLTGARLGPPTFARDRPRGTRGAPAAVTTSTSDRSSSSSSAS